MYRKQISQKASPSQQITLKNQDITPCQSYRSLSSVVQRAQQTPDKVSKDERQQLESAIGTRATGEVLAGKQTPWVPDFQGISSQLWGNSGQVGEPIQAKESEAKPENQTGLPDNLKAGIENLSGMAMDDVRVHYNSSKPANLQALAYTQGTEIHVAPGQEKHLPHEAWHVVQQKQGRVKPTMQMKGVGINDDLGLEREADVMGEEAMQMKVKLRLNNSTANTTSRLVASVTQRVGAGVQNVAAVTQATMQNIFATLPADCKKNTPKVSENKHGDNTITFTWKSAIVFQDGSKADLKVNGHPTNTGTGINTSSAWITGGPTGHGIQSAAIPAGVVTQLDTLLAEYHNASSDYYEQEYDDTYDHYYDD